MDIKTNLSNNIDQQFRTQIINNFENIIDGFDKLNKSMSESDENIKNDVSKMIDGLRATINKLIVGSDKGDSSIEVTHARYSRDGQEYETIGQRLDSIEKALDSRGIKLNE